jgi:hypothetical protein
MPSFTLCKYGILLFLSFPFFSCGQVSLLKFVPGAHYTDPFHRVELYHEGTTPINLGGYLLVTRDYLLRFPDPLWLPPQAVLLVTYHLSGSERRPNLIAFSFQETEEFIVRKRSLEKRGNYVVLFDKNGKMVDGFYFSPSFYTAFLPDTAFFITPTGRVIPYYIPVETDKRWSYLSAPEDPAIGFVNLSGQWQFISANPHINILDIVRFQSVSGYFTSSVITLQFLLDASVSFLSRILIYKGEDPEQLVRYDSLPVQPSGSYRYLDIEVQKNHRYYYRIGVEDVFGYQTFSPLIQVYTGHEDVFTLRTLPSEVTAGEQFFLFIESKKEGEITLDLYTRNYEYQKPLYIGYIEADLPLLLPLDLDPGEYCVLLTQNKRRHMSCFEVH